MSKEESSRLEQEIIKEKNFPNTYTYAKNLAEKVIVKHQGHVKLVICRPTIIACTMKDPFPGWTDSMSAAGGISMLGGLGVKHTINLDETSKKSLDVVPVDSVTNSVIICTAFGSYMQPGKNMIYQQGSSYNNPISTVDFSWLC